MNVKLLCEKSFSEDDREIVDRFVEFQEALIEANTDKLDEFILKTDEFVNLIGLQSKKEFISSVGSDVLKFNGCEIIDPTILFDDVNSASLIAKVRLSVEINGKELRVISDSVVSFEKTDGKWCLGKWEN
ncbi:hypothetical protein [Methanobrevibacter sp.]|uniref:hypothetical protein n=1 Tax=Methanobrevibacter sp. TaxID=66852 RepID=UPI0038679A75